MTAFTEPVHVSALTGEALMEAYHDLFQIELACGALGMTPIGTLKYKELYRTLRMHMTREAALACVKQRISEQSGFAIESDDKEEIMRLLAEERGIRLYDDETGRDCAPEGYAPSIPPVMEEQPLTRLELSGVEEQQRADSGAVAVALGVLALFAILLVGGFAVGWWLFHR